MAAVVAKAREVLGAGPVYISFDVDSLDPGFAPGTGTPEVGGLTRGKHWRFCAASMAWM
jgi:agmatinase